MTSLAETMTAIHTEFTSGTGESATLRGLVTGLYASEAPAGTSYDYITWNIVGDTSDPIFSRTNEEFRVQYTIWSDDLSPLKSIQIRDALVAAFHHNKLQNVELPGEDFISTAKKVGGVGPVKDPGDSSVWSTFVDFELYVAAHR